MSLLQRDDQQPSKIVRTGRFLATQFENCLFLMVLATDFFLDAVIYVYLKVVEIIKEFKNT